MGMCCGPRCHFIAVFLSLSFYRCLFIAVSASVSLCVCGSYRDAAARVHLCLSRPLRRREIRGPAIGFPSTHGALLQIYAAQCNATIDAQCSDDTSTMPRCPRLAAACNGVQRSKPSAKFTLKPVPRTESTPLVSPASTAVPPSAQSVSRALRW